MRKYFIFLMLLAMSVPLMAQHYDFVVAKDGTGDFLKIQEAIDACADYFQDGRQRILVKKGVYEEKVIVPSSKTHVSLIGEEAETTVLIWHDYATMQIPAGTNQGKTLGAFQSYTLRVDGLDFECENMTIRNDAMNYNHPDWIKARRSNIGQAVAVHVEGDKSVFRNCQLKGVRNTLLTGNEDSRQVYYNCYIEGATDFILGPATCWFENCELHVIANGCITAAATPEGHPYGYVFYHCKVTSDEKVTRAYLGRPWRNYASVVFNECELPASIAAEGWKNAKDPEREKTVRYYEYHCKGEGASLEKRVPWLSKMPPEEATNLQARRVLFRENDVWNSNFRPVDFFALHFAFCNEYQEKGTPYVSGTLEPEQMPEHPESAVEPLVMRFNAVDCTTFVEYMSAALLGRCDNPLPDDEIMKRYVEALRYRKGVRGNYATRKHYFTDWIIDNEKQGLLTDITETMPGAKRQRKKIDFMTSHKNLYPQLAASPELVRQMREVEEYLSARELCYVPVNNMRKVLPLLRDGDIVTFVTKKEGLDVSHVGFVWQRDSWHGEPHLLHASSKMGRVVVSQQTLTEFAGSLPGCIGIKIIRLNTD